MKMDSERIMHGRAFLESILLTSDDGLKTAPFYFLVSKLSSKSTTEVRYGWLCEDESWIREEYNYHQIFRKRVRRHIDKRDQEYSLRKKVIEMAREFELAYIFGRRQQVINNIGFFSSMGGLADFVKSKDVEEPFIVDEKINGEIIREIYNVSTLGRYAFVPPHMFDKLEAFETIPTDKTFGIPIKQVRSSIATINVVADPLLMYKMAAREGGELCWKVVVAELTNLTRVYLQNRDWQAWELGKHPMMSLDGILTIENPYKYDIMVEQSLVVLNPGANMMLNLKGENV